MTRKRSKLVLPAPQISDLELEEVVKLGVASEQARQQAEEAPSTRTHATGQLLANYELTPDLARLRTPMLDPTHDTVLTESQNILALQLVDTPLKGGLNTPLHQNGAATPMVGASGRAGGLGAVHTPNTMFTTPFRTPQGEVMATPTRSATGSKLAIMPSQSPHPSSSSRAGNALAIAGASPSSSAASATPGSTVSGPTLASSSNIRDKLSINPEEALAADYDDKARHREHLERLRKGLSKLPAPKNDYEIVLPDDQASASSSAEPRIADEDDEEALGGEQQEVADQADVEAKRRVAAQAKHEWEMKHKSQAIQRSLPRPSDINHNVLRPAEMSGQLSDYQHAEEMIKREMLVMLHHDAAHSPTWSQCGVPAASNAKRSALATGPVARPLQMDKHQHFLREHTHDKFSLEEMAEARALLEREVPAVRKHMGHAEQLGDDAFGQVWDECYAQLLFVPSTSRFTRTSVASRKDKIESCEKRLEVNRFHMSVEAKRAAKLEQRLKVTLGGYQSRAQVLAKALEEVNAQTESRALELNTFNNIRERELLAIPKRIEALDECVARQVERERDLQTRFGQLMIERDLLINRN